MFSPLSACIFISNLVTTTILNFCIYDLILQYRFMGCNELRILDRCWRTDWFGGSWLNQWQIILTIMHQGVNVRRKLCCLKSTAAFNIIINKSSSTAFWKSAFCSLLFFLIFSLEGKLEFKLQFDRSDWTLTSYKETSIALDLEFKFELELGILNWKSLRCFPSRSSAVWNC